MIGGLGGAFLAKALVAPNLLGDPSFTLNAGNLLVEMFFSFSLVLTVLQTTVSLARPHSNACTDSNPL